MDMERTKQLMDSGDYRDRIKAEYWQVKNRYEKLHHRIIKIEAGTLKSDWGDQLMTEQCRHMGNYLHCLEVRAEREGIDLFHDEDERVVVEA